MSTMRIIKPLAVIFLFSTLFSCKTVLDIDCEEALRPADPVPRAQFRLLSATGNDDLIANNTVNFDSLQVIQPCNINDTLKKNLMPNGSGGYVFSFEDVRQPVVEENAECYRMYLKWSSTDTDEIEFVVRGEYDPCGTIYYIDRVLFNGKQVANKDGAYLLRK